MNALLDIRADIASGRPVVALESTLIAHGLPYPTNIETARASEAAVRQAGAIPATIAVINGRPVVGISDAQIEALAQGKDVFKASRRDLAAAIALKRTAATTVSATMALAHAAGIRIFATGGIGGVHKSPPNATGGLDVSSDLTELARTPVAVVCAGAKSLLDLPATLEYLETLAVPVIGFGCDEFPAFYLTTCGERVSPRVNDADTAARMMQAHWSLGGRGVVIAQPPPKQLAIQPAQFAAWLTEAERLAADAKIAGPAVTPFILRELARLSDGATVKLNQALIVANAELAGRITVALTSVASQ